MKEEQRLQDELKQNDEKAARDLREKAV